MWIVFAFASAFFAGVTSVLAKCGIRDTDSNVATALRTVVVLLFSWLMVFVTGAQNGLAEISAGTLIFLVLSGLCTGASWLCYFRALQLGNINQVVPIDKSGTVMAMLLSFLFLHEQLTVFKVCSMLLIGVGTFLMIRKKENTAGNPAVRETHGKRWMLYAFGSAFFASMTSVFGKIGIENINSNPGTAIRTVVVLIMAWVVVFVTKKQHTVRQIDRKSWVFLLLSGLVTGVSWMCYYHALQTGPASSVVPIDKLSILVTIAFSYVVFRERLTWKSGIGLILLVSGSLMTLI